MWAGCEEYVPVKADERLAALRDRVRAVFGHSGAALELALHPWCHWANSYMEMMHLTLNEVAKLKASLERLEKATASKEIE